MGVIGLIASADLALKHSLILKATNGHGRYRDCIALAVYSNSLASMDRAFESEIRETFVNLFLRSINIKTNNAEGDYINLK